MSYQQTSKLSEPCVCSFDDPAARVTTQLASIFVTRLLVVLAVGCDQFDSSLLQPFPQWVGVIGLVRDHSLRLLPRPAFGSGDADFGERGFGKLSFSRRGTFKPNSQWKTPTVDQYHPLRALATLGFTDCRASFLAGAKLPSRKLSSHCNKPLPSRVPSSARQASSQTSSSSRCFRRHQQVAGEGYLSGRNRHAAPVPSIHNMPSRQARFEAHRRPRLSFRRFPSSNSGSINNHCASVNNSKRFLSLQEAQQNSIPSESTQIEAKPIYETRSRSLTV
jgi:hypothetical protein